MQRQYYSQFGQDKWIVEDVFDFEENRYFLDLAAGDGIYFSNTYYLEKYLNWKGICIEANDAIFERLKNNRTCVCEHACVDSKWQEVKFTITNLEVKSDRTLKSYLIGGIIDNDVLNKDKDNKDFILKQTVTLEEILKKYNAPKIIDFFSLDVKGSETRVLKDFPFNKYIFLSLSVDNPGKLLHSVLKKNGYLVVGRNPFDRLYIHNSIFYKFDNKKKFRIYCHNTFRFFKNDIIRKIDGIVYYSRHIKEIPSMIKRKFLQLFY